ncbi:2-C-methyl-D-erythritol 4-phosphate cytidylyltransferase [Microbacterium xanthum]|uniref:2-C-methyl-D-erythritol 4-phosphate cytidylyltransferase n=1 Tax=Microbacterium xanthum TaxID=3079794 RepID=UPI002AD4AC66|nr:MULTISPECIES: 2-C-methyl-D-erythritol 4-phosphate cytidylyltransferase [unclassified Microbacterium]MDZ8171932.1 2-C-methyl-D-erythritol 4-phosphate cytidylyltransferase [Microbacterium sp. KSW-48]MDZ8199971.1 2-C-methyl-D-erythritol 4-phosphate cytidylyltransferase [Microbacterium sp. SSW1-59]
MSITPVPHVAVIVVAAGDGTRLNAGGPKALVGIDAHSILRHCLERVFQAPSAQVVVVAPAGREGDALTDAVEAAGPRRDLVTVVTGGPSRQASVAAGLAALWGDVRFVLVHDAARALTPPEVFGRVIDELESGADGAVPVLPVIDTIKRVDRGAIIGAVDRSELSAAQTPQGFRRGVLDAAYASAASEHTDDAALVAEAGHEVTAVPGDASAFKITTPADLERARHLLASSPSSPPRTGVPSASGAPRVGVGTDVHGFAEGGELRLAGLTWPGEPALAGHSDGDAVAHAIVDALLSAAGLGDIGTSFGTDRPEYDGAHGEVFLRRTVAILGEAGWHVGNVAVQIQANRPRFSPRRLEAERALSAALGGAAVSVSATTTDGLGFTGRGEGVAVTAVALVLPA